MAHSIHIYPAPIQHETRIFKIAQTLVSKTEFNKITLVGCKSPGLPNFSVLSEGINAVRLPFPFKKGYKIFRVIGLLIWYVRVLFFGLTQNNVTSVHAHSLPCLPLALVIAKLRGALLIYDTHELETETLGLSGIRRKTSKWLERQLIARVDYTFVVGTFIEKWYRNTYKNIPISTVRNTPHKFLIEQHPHLPERSNYPLRKKLGLSEDVVLFVYLGIFGAARGLEIAINAFGSQPGVALVLIGFGELKAALTEQAAHHQNVWIEPPVAPNEVVAYARMADVGICLASPDCLSYQYGLPNKFFEYLQAGIPVLVSPLDEMSMLIRQYGCGETVDLTLEAVRAVIPKFAGNSIKAYANGVHKAALDLCWENEEQTLVRTYEALFTEHKTPGCYTAPLAQICTSEVATPSMAKRLPYKICTRCVMDTSDPKITFLADGTCNHCNHYFERIKNEISAPDQRDAALARLVRIISASGRGKAYDCLIGVSGGVDSTYVAHHVKKLGLRPLAVHLDNGWNSELAVQNIKLTLDRLNIDLITHVIDWEEFVDIQKSFLAADVPNCEIPTDHAINALLIKTAAKHGIKYVLNGGNLVSEGIMPISWGHYNQDLMHLKAVHKRFGHRPIKTLPTVSLIRMIWSFTVGGIKYVPLLNYLTFDKPKAMEILQNELGWRPYGAKHFESIYTRFFQGYILPRKFGFDKRRAHFSSLVCAGQLDREKALVDLKNDPYYGHDLASDLTYVIKKLQMTDAEFEAMMHRAPKVHADYPNRRWFFEDLVIVKQIFKRFVSRV